MFTGIVSAVGTVAEAGNGRLVIKHAATTRALRVGGSVAVNGCCLTVVKKSATAFEADVVPETLRRTNLGALEPGSHVNLELPVSPTGLLDGHLVQGHIDATASVQAVQTEVTGRELTIDLPAEMAQFIVEKGSIAVDGVSLTVAGTGLPRGTFRVAMIPHTLEVTIAGEYTAGATVNLEADVIARYVVRNLRR
jgi:riboflavin synthase